MDSSTVSLLEYAKNLDNAECPEITRTKLPSEESTIINAIREKSFRDHKTKCELRSKIENAEKRITVLESIVSSKGYSNAKQNNFSSNQRKGFISNQATAKNSFQPPRTFETSAVRAKAMKASKLTSKPSSDISFSTSSSEDSSSFGISSSTSPILKDSKKFGAKCPTAEAKHAQNNAVKGKTASTCSGSTTFGLSTTSTSFSTPKSTRTASRIAHQAAKHTTKTVSTKKKESFSDSLSDVSSDSSDSSSFTFSSSETGTDSDSDSFLESSKSISNHNKHHSKSNSHHKSSKHRRASTKKTVKTERHPPSYYLKQNEERESLEKARRYLKNHEEKSNALLNDYLNEWKARNEAKNYENRSDPCEVLSDMERYANVKFNELDGIVDNLRKSQDHASHRRMNKLEKENSKLRSNMRKIKDITHAYKRKRELRKIDEMFGAISEKELLQHIATKFHDFLRTEEDISRETALKLIDRASNQLKQ